MYLIKKKRGDARLTTCGVIIPDGFYVVMNMTFENQRQIQNIKKFGYEVTETDLPEGTYTPDGRRVDKWSARDHFLSRTPLKYLDTEPAGPPENEKTEVQQLRDELESKGIKVRADAKLETLQKRLETA